MNYNILCNLLAGPNDGTVEDMWRTIHDTKSSTIVMLANPVENGKVGTVY